MDPDETQMFIEAFWWRLEIEDRKQAHYTSMQLMAAGVKKDKAKPKKIKFLSEWHSDDGDEAKELEGEPSTDKPKKKRSAEDDKAAFKRLKEHSKQRAAEHRAS